MLINSTQNTSPFALGASPNLREAKSAEIAELLGQQKARRAELGANDLANYRGYAGGLAADIELTSSLGDELSRQMQIQTSEANRRQMEARNRSNPFRDIAENSTTVTVDAWKKGENDCIERILLGQGYSRQEIYAKGKDGKTLVDRVVEANGLESPTQIQPGQTIEVPTRKEMSVKERIDEIEADIKSKRSQGQDDVGPVRRETSPSREADGVPASRPRPDSDDRVGPDPQCGPSDATEPRSVQSPTNISSAQGFRADIRAQAIFRALENAKIDRLPGMLMDLSNQQLQDVKAIYPQVDNCGLTLEQHIQMKLGGGSDLRLHTILSVVAGNRPENGEMGNNDMAALEAAHGIRSAFERKTPDIKYIVTFLTSHSDEFIAKTNDRLYNISAKALTLWTVVDKLLVMREAGPIDYLEMDPVVLKCLLARLPKGQGYKKAD